MAALHSHQADSAHDHLCFTTEEASQISPADHPTWATQNDNSYTAAVSVLAHTYSTSQRHQEYHILCTHNPGTVCLDLDDIQTNFSKKQS
jgi:hypothetical protein